MPNNINDKMKEVVKKSTFNNNQSSTPINTTNKKKDTINFNNVIKNLSTSPNTKPWYKKKASIIGMSSTLGVGVLATAIAVPIVLTSQSSSTIVLPPTQQDVDAFNAKPLTEKIVMYNDLLVSKANELQTNFFNNGTFLAWMNTNMILPTGQEPNADIVQNLKKFISDFTDKANTLPSGFGTDNRFNINYLKINPNSPLDSNVIHGLTNNFLSIQASGATNPVDVSKAYNILNAHGFMVYADKISDLEIKYTNELGFYFEITLTPTIANEFKIGLVVSKWIIGNPGTAENFLYKNNIIISEKSLIPNLSSYIATDILKQ